MSILGHTPAPSRALVPGTPGDLERVCMKALCRNREDRYAHARALLEDLARVRDGRPVPDHEGIPAHQSTVITVATRRHWPAMLASIGAAATLAGLV